jgi:hypothetical protein
MTEYELLMVVSAILDKPFQQVIQTPYITLLREMTETYVDVTENLLEVIRVEN